MSIATDGESEASKSDPRPRPKGAIALEWWRGMNDPQRGDRGALAELRRARSTVDAAASHAAIVLAVRLGGQKNDWKARNALDLARVLAHVRGHLEGASIMRIAGFPKFVNPMRAPDSEDSQPVLSEVRFRRLLRTGDGEEKVAAFTRLVRLLESKVPVDSLAHGFSYWNHPRFGDAVRERWAFDYYAAGSSAPHSTTPELEDSSE